MRERASLVKGTVSITSTPTGGTEINVLVPWVPAKEASELTFDAA
jgi:nitrate/nitrite-specific signal transduction histidine kinase